MSFRYLLLALIMSTALLGACSKAKNSQQSTDIPIRQGHAPEDVAAAAATLAQDNTAFACELYRRLRPGNDNLFLSPWSISNAFAMAYAGAEGQTAAQMASALNFTLTEQLLHPAFAELDAKLTAAQAGEGVRLDVANSLWPQADYPLLEDYLALLKEYYGVSVTQVDYREAREEARALINAWVEAKTEDKIRNLIQPGVLTALTRLVLVNAIYFKGSWESPFDGKDTQLANFTVAPGRPVKTPMMNQTGDFKYADLDSLEILQLPYQGGQLALTILLPEAIDGLTWLEGQLSADHLTAWQEQLVRQKIKIQVPQFKLTSSFRLDQSLRAMGMEDAFDASAADFAGMDGKPNWLFIGAAVHKAFVEVNETGTEAAAATGLVMGLTSVPQHPIFRANHPFVFLIQEIESGNLLFLGRLVDPTKEGE